MSTNDEIVKRRPVDRTAARVVAAGPKHLELKKRIEQTHSATPLPTIPIQRDVTDLRGRVFGRLTVTGVAEVTTGSHTGGNQRLWVCRCVCGSYLTRRAKAINNPKNDGDCCDHCRELIFLQRRQRQIESGEYVPGQKKAPSGSPEGSRDTK